MGNAEEGMTQHLGAEQVRLMQGLAREVTILRPEVLGGATVGELAWQFGKDRAAIGDRWRYRLWFCAEGNGRLDAWAWVSLPYTVGRSDGSTATSHSANLTWQVHPDHPELLDEILDWYAEQAAGTDRFVSPQDADTDMLVRLPAHGYTPDTEADGYDGDWHQFNLNASGMPYQAYRKAVTHPNYGFITDQNIDELRRVYNRKFPHKLPSLERFLALVLTGCRGGPYTRGTHRGRSPRPR